MRSVIDLQYGRGVPNRYPIIWRINKTPKRLIDEISERRQTEITKIKSADKSLYDVEREKESGLKSILKGTASDTKNGGRIPLVILKYLSVPTKD